MAVAERCVRLRVFGAEATGFEPTLSTPEYCWGSVSTDSGDCPSSIKHYQALFGATKRWSGGAVNAPVGVSSI